MPSLAAQQLLQFFASLPDNRRYWVAYSGGLDSHVLLHLLAQLREQPELPVCHAVHVHHGLSANADHWVEHCEATAAQLQIPLTVLHVDAQAKEGESPEAAARDARYAAIAELLVEGDCLLTAHHQEDQAETLLLQLLRGAGPKGLAAMPIWQPFPPAVHARPLLTNSQQQLLVYAKQHGLSWIDDESNADTRFDRNYLRHEIMPRLQKRWPATARVLSRSASHHAEATDILDEVAQQDLLQVRVENALLIPVLCQLSLARQKNLLRYWLLSLGLSQPGSVHLQHILDDVLMAVVDAEPRVTWPGAEVKRYRDRLYASGQLSEFDGSQVLVWDGQSPIALDGLACHWLAVSDQGVGLRAELLQGDVEVRFRQGGESIQPVGRRGRHALKKLFQEQGVPPWQRDRLPLIYINDQLVAVANLWVAEGYQAEQQEAGITLLCRPC